MQKRHLTCSVVEKKPICWNPPHKVSVMQGCKARQSVKITSHSLYYIMKWVSEACRQIRDIVWWFGKCRHFSSPTHTRNQTQSPASLQTVAHDVFFFFFSPCCRSWTLQGLIINNWPSPQQYRWDMVDSSLIIFTKFSVKKKFCAVLLWIMLWFYSCVTVKLHLCHFSC